MCGAGAHEAPDVGLRVFVLRRYVEEGDADWLKGLDVVVAHDEEEAKELAEELTQGLGRWDHIKA